MHPCTNLNVNFPLIFSEHPLYDDDELINDVSVVQTRDEILFNNFAQPIALIDQLITSGTLRTSGWGDTSPSGSPTPNELRWLETDVVPLNECQRLLPGLTNPDTFCVYSKFNADLESYSQSVTSVLCVYFRFSQSRSLFR